MAFLNKKLAANPESRSGALESGLATWRLTSGTSDFLCRAKYSIKKYQPRTIQHSGSQTAMSTGWGEPVDSQIPLPHAQVLRFKRSRKQHVKRHLRQLCGRYSEDPYPCGPNACPGAAAQRSFCTLQTEASAQARHSSHRAGTLPVGLRALPPRVSPSRRQPAVQARGSSTRWLPSYLAFREGQSLCQSLGTTGGPTHRKEQPHQWLPEGIMSSAAALPGLDWTRQPASAGSDTLPCCHWVTHLGESCCPGQCGASVGPRASREVGGLHLVQLPSLTGTLWAQTGSALPPTISCRNPAIHELGSFKPDVNLKQDEGRGRLLWKEQGSKAKKIFD
ncbi:uncharacterized protein LOC120884230 [Ictidomys tridecemlineatus]